MIKFKALPALQTEPKLDYHLQVSQKKGKEILYLAYAMRRDYLSVPLTHVVIEFDDGTYHKTESKLAAIDVKSQESVGFFESEHSVVEGSMSYLILNLDKFALEISYRDYQKTTLYYQESAEVAIQTFLEAN